MCCVGIVGRMGDAYGTGVGKGANGAGEREIASGWFWSLLQSVWWRVLRCCYVVWPPDPASGGRGVR